MSIDFIVQSFAGTAGAALCTLLAERDRQAVQTMDWATAASSQAAR